MHHKKLLFPCKAKANVVSVVVIFFFLLKKNTFIQIRPIIHKKEKIYSNLSASLLISWTPCVKFSSDAPDVSDNLMH